ncbi:hypothetical protein ACYZUD_10100 [Pseudomonas sp. XS1P51]
MYALLLARFQIEIESDEGTLSIATMRDEGYAYRDALEADDVPVSLYLGKGKLHGSLRAQGAEQVEAFYDALAQAISTFLASAHYSIEGTPNASDLGCDQPRSQERAVHNDSPGYENEQGARRRL